MKLVSNRILIIPEPPTREINGIYLPDISLQDRNTGLIVLIGDTVDKKFSNRRVLFNRAGVQNMTYNGVDALLLWVHDVIAILD